jgi:hypothetical protein
MEVVLWSAWGREWAESDPGPVLARLERRLEAGAIVLLHDTEVSAPAGTAARTHATLELLAAALSERRLRATTLDELLVDPQLHRLDREQDHRHGQVPAQHHHRCLASS